MILITGGAGFIGSRLARALVADGADVLVADDRPASGPGGNLQGVALAGQVGQGELMAGLRGRAPLLDGVEAVLHQGACSDTTEMDEAFLQANNVDASVAVLDACTARGVPLVYASSAAVYGSLPDAVEAPGHVDPLNPYARSKAAVDAVVWARLDHLESQVVGLRYFNVFGPGERHKGPMASLVLQLFDQLRADGTATLFGEGEGAGPGEHRRDFVWVDDVVAVVRWFLDHPEARGIYNCGTGRSRTFNDLARATIAAVGEGELRYRPFPDALRGRYQARTQADLSRLRAVGCDVAFTDLETAVAATVGDLLAEADGGVGSAG